MTADELARALRRTIPANLDAHSSTKPLGRRLTRPT